MATAQQLVTIASVHVKFAWKRFECSAANFNANGGR
jgi:hypothetical protein